ncbi:hypothetical protein [Sphingobacterium prati]|uniref:hypothetical protein n=1 Tax=Sphingobacterium prati TaxID=2737006 RepID=UPI001C12E543|nr:hypothetical protein [Sphingobacterium prati]
MARTLSWTPVYLQYHSLTGMPRNLIGSMVWEARHRDGPLLVKAETIGIKIMVALAD